MMKKTGFVAMVCAVAAISACGGGGGTSTGPTLTATPIPSPTPAPPVVLLQTNFTLRNGFVGLFRTLSVSGPGTLEITVDWTLASNDLDISLVKGSCTGEMYDADTCVYMAFADSLTAKPEKLRVSVAAGTYTPLVDNFGPGDESGAIQVVFTPGASAAAVAASQPARLKNHKGRIVAEP
jgi:hypothetical protein